MSSAASIETLAGEVAAGVAAGGIAVVRDFLSRSAIAELREEAARLRAQGAFRPAGIGAGGDYRTRQDIRGDEICWIEPDTPSAPLRALLCAMEQLRLGMNRELMLGLFDLECHLASYAPGAGYQRHYDQLRGDGRRLLTVTLYLNESWREGDGGILRVYLDDGERTLDVMPEGGTLVAFLSARYSHEVLPCTRERLSFTGWFRHR